MWLATGGAVEGGDIGVGYVFFFSSSILSISICLIGGICILTEGLGKHRDLQRVTVPYAKLLGMVDNEDAMET